MVKNNFLKLKLSYRISLLEIIRMKMPRTSEEMM